MKLNKSRIKPKRERGHNWSTKEKIVLFECVKEYLHIVSDCRNAVEVRKKKNLTWAWIAKQCKEMGIFVNETVKIKTQWKRMRIAAKKNIHAYQNGLSIDGKLVVPSELDWNVYSAMANICANRRRIKPSEEDELSLPNEIKHEMPVDFAFDNMSNTIQIPDDVYSIEDESVSSHSNISLESQTSNFENTSQLTTTFQESENILQQGAPQTSTVKNHTNLYQKAPSELDWSLYNAITSVCAEKQSKTLEAITNSLPSEIKYEQPDEHTLNNMPTAMQITNDINAIEKSSKSVQSYKSSGTQTSNIEFINHQTANNSLNEGAYDLQQSNEENHQAKILAVQLKIEEAKLKEIEERIHHQRVIFELNKTLLQKQIENESVKKYI